MKQDGIYIILFTALTEEATSSITSRFSIPHAINNFTPMRGMTGSYQKALKELEPSAVKVARWVLRGAGSGNRAGLLGAIGLKHLWSAHLKGSGVVRNSQH